MNQSMYSELQADVGCFSAEQNSAGTDTAAELLRALQFALEDHLPLRDGEQMERLGLAEDALEQMLPPDLLLSFRRMCDQSTAAAEEYGETCFARGVRCGLLLMADAYRLDGEQTRFSVDFIASLCYNKGIRNSAEENGS